MIKDLSLPKNAAVYVSGAGLVVLAVLVGWLLLQALSFGSGAAVLPDSSRDAASPADLSTAIEPNDQKLLDKGYVAILMNKGEQNMLANVHPADRKFLSESYANYSASFAGRDPMATVHAADRKFFINVQGIDPLARVNPADRKFYTNTYLYNR